MALENITLTVEEVRTALQEIDSDEIPDSTIEQAIEYESIYVASRLPEDWKERDDITDEQVRMILLAEVKRRSWNTSGTVVRRQALDAVVSLDIQAFRGQLNDDAERAWATIGIYEDGTSAPFVDSTSHAPGGGTEERNRRASWGWE